VYSSSTNITELTAANKCFTINVTSANWKKYLVKIYQVIFSSGFISQIPLERRKKFFADLAAFSPKRNVNVKPQVSIYAYELGLASYEHRLLRNQSLHFISIKLCLPVQNQMMSRRRKIARCNVPWEPEWYRTYCGPRVSCSFNSQSNLKFFSNFNMHLQRSRQFTMQQ
jgi:hypothetical protein